MIRVKRPDSLPKATDRFVVVEASAGTGKTYFLEHRVADLVIEGADLSQILLVTFTDKAVAELRLRIRDLLDRLARATEDSDTSLASGSGPVPTFDSDSASASGSAPTASRATTEEASATPTAPTAKRSPKSGPISVPMATATGPVGVTEVLAERSNLIPFNAAIAKSLGLERTAPAANDSRLVREANAAASMITEVTAAAFAAAIAPPRARRPSEPGATSWSLDDAAKKRLRDAVTAFDHAPIFTIHGFCYRILVEDAFAAQRLFEQTQVADEVAFDAAFLSLLRERFANVEPDRSLLAAYLSRGDTVDKLRALLLQCARKDAAPRITYTPETAIELGQALQVVFGSSVARDALLEKLAFKGTDKRYGPGWIQHVARCVEEWDGTAPGVFVMCDAIRRPIGSKANPGPKLLERVVKVPQLAPIADILRRAIAMTSLDEACASVMLPHVLERIGRDKAENGMFDYNDMLQLVRDALRGPRGADLAARLRARTPWVMIDEFQDTDPVQWEIFRTVWMDDAARGLTIVGDPKQAIYGFRGADVATYLDAREELEQRGATRVDLDVNRRSTAPMVDALNKILLADGISPLLDQAIRYDHPVAASGDVELLAPRAPITVFQMLGEGRREESRQALAAAIGLEIDKLRAHPPAWQHRGAQPVFTLGHCMVLTRTNVESDTVAQALRARGIACALVEGDRLFETREAHELADVLAAVAAPRDRSARMRALRTRYFDVAWNDLMRIVDAPDHHPLIARLFDWASLASKRAYEALFRRVVEDSRFAERALVLGGGERAIINTWHMIELMLEEVARSRSDLHELVTQLRRWITDGSDLPDDRDVQRAETDTDAVKILTVHKAKGLEAPYVFLYGGASPPRASAVHTLRDRGRRALVVGPQDDAIQKQLDAEADAENQRLAYVALTRAKVRMYLPHYPENVVDARSMYWAIQRCLAPLAFRKDRLLEIVDVTMGGTGAPPAPLDALANFQPPTMPGELATASAISGARAGLAMLSYTRLAKELDAAAIEPGELPVAIDPAEFDAEPASAPAAVIAPNELPPGIDSGLFLHDLFEAADLALLRDRDLVAWTAEPSVTAMIVEHARERGIAATYHAHGARLVHHTLTAPVQVVGREPLPPLIAATAFAREVEFAYPIPGGTSSRDGRPRGLVKGFIDALVAYDDELWVLDYKSDVLAGDPAATAEDHARSHYTIQHRLYTLAAARFRGQRRLAGMLYSFVRYGITVALPVDDDKLAEWTSWLANLRTEL
ncbi:MAG: UvrD-helicase domain-containing protein [Kofleriaceae bacterium]